MRRVNLSILACCVLGALVAYSAYSFMGPSPKPPARPKVADLAAAAQMPLSAGIDPAPPAADPASPPPSWVSATPLSAASDTPPSASPAEAERKRQLAAALDELQRLQGNANPDPAAIAAAFGKLEKANGSPVFHGIRLDALRNNIEISQKMQPIADEVNKAMQAMSGPSAAPSPEQWAALKVKREQLEALSKQMRSDITVPRAASERP